MKYSLQFNSVIHEVCTNKQCFGRLFFSPGCWCCCCCYWEHKQRKMISICLKHCVINLCFVIEKFILYKATYYIPFQSCQSFVNRFSMLQKTKRRTHAHILFYLHAYLQFFLDGIIRMPFSRLHFCVLLNKSQHQQNAKRRLYSVLSVTMPYAHFFFITHSYAGNAWIFVSLFQGIPKRLLLSFGLSTNIKSILSTKKLPQVNLKYQL